MTHYTPQMIVRAREHDEAGWSVEDIRRHIAREFDVDPTWHTVKRWVDPAFASRERKRRNREQLATKAAEHGPGRPYLRMSRELRVARMAELHRRRVSLRAIGQVAAIWWGEELSEAQVRKTLAALGERVS